MYRSVPYYNLLYFLFVTIKALFPMSSRAEIVHRSPLRKYREQQQKKARSPSVPDRGSPPKKQNGSVLNFSVGYVSDSEHSEDSNCSSVVHLTPQRKHHDNDTQSQSSTSVVSPPNNRQRSSLGFVYYSDTDSEHSDDGTIFTCTSAQPDTPDRVGSAGNWITVSRFEVRSQGGVLHQESWINAFWKSRWQCHDPNSVKPTKQKSHSNLEWKV